MVEGVTGHFGPSERPVEGHYGPVGGDKEHPLEGRIGGDDGRPLAGHAGVNDGHSLEGSIGGEPSIKARPGKPLVSVIPVKIGGKNYYAVVIKNGVQQAFQDSDAHLLAEEINTHFSPVHSEIENELDPDDRIIGFRYNASTKKMAYITDTVKEIKGMPTFWKTKKVHQERARLPEVSQKLNDLANNFGNLVDAFRTYDTEINKDEDERVEGESDLKKAEPFGPASHFPAPNEEYLTELKDLFASDEATFDALSDREKTLDRNQMSAIINRLIDKRDEQGQLVDGQIMRSANIREVKIRNPKMSTVGEEDYPTKGQHCLMVPYKKDGQTQYAGFILDFENDEIWYHSPQGDSIDDAKLEKFSNNLTKLFDPDHHPGTPRELNNTSTDDPTQRNHRLLEFFTYGTMKDATFESANQDHGHDAYFDTIHDLLS
ncbi:MAG: hypothetical protein P0S94_02990 [Simkaniaceae bacterium]|nr:hypothetical protein [Simkaniaceae bacterium]